MSRQNTPDEEEVEEQVQETLEEEEEDLGDDQEQGSAQQAGSSGAKGGGGPAASDEAIAQALDCPCVQDLRESACGPAFVAAFTCFHKSTQMPKGLECEDINRAFAECLQLHPEALEGLKGVKEAGQSLKASG